MLSFENMKYIMMDKTTLNVAAVVSQTRAVSGNGTFFSNYFKITKLQKSNNVFRNQIMYFI